MNATICRAIHDRAVLQFSYDGRSRIVEPFCHGVSTAGYDVLRAYQIGGHSESGSAPRWRLYRVSEMSGLCRTGNTFAGIRPGYNPQDQQMLRVYCHV